MSKFSNDSTSKFVQTEDWKLHFNDVGVGEGEVILMIHGSGPGATGWANFHRNVDPFVEAGYRVILMDCPGFGKSDAVVSDEPRFDLNGRAIGQLLNALGIEKAHLVGNSMGGASALAFARNNQNRVGKLILMGSAGVGPYSVFTPVPMEGIGLLMKLYADPTMVNLKQMLDVFVYDPSQLTEELIELRHQSILSMPQHLENFLKSHQLSKGVMGDYSGDLPAIDNETLITWGRDDRFVPLDWGLKLLQLMPNSTLHVFSRCGHWAQWEHADAFNRLVLDFLKH